MMNIQSQQVKRLIVILHCALRCIPIFAADIEYPGETASKSTIAFGSCHKIKAINATDGVVWDAIGNLKPDAFIWTGKLHPMCLVCEKCFYKMLIFISLLKDIKFLTKRLDQHSNLHTLLCQVIRFILPKKEQHPFPISYLLTTT